jgi:hypothetical protein
MANLIIIINDREISSPILLKIVLAITCLFSYVPDYFNQQGIFVTGNFW